MTNEKNHHPCSTLFTLWLCHSLPHTDIKCTLSINNTVVMILLLGEVYADIYLYF